MEKNYDWKITLKKGFTGALLYGAPAIIELVLRGNPTWASLTIGSLLVMFSNWIKHRNK